MRRALLVSFTVRSVAEFLILIYQLKCPPGTREDFVVGQYFWGIEVSSKQLERRDLIGCGRPS